MRLRRFESFPRHHPSPGERFARSRASDGKPPFAIGAGLIVAVKPVTVLEEEFAGLPAVAPKQRSGRGAKAGVTQW
jgi:hypothetical protein